MADYEYGGIYGVPQLAVDVTALALFVLAETAIEPRRASFFTGESDTAGRGWLLSEDTWESVSDTGIGANLAFSAEYLADRDGGGPSLREVLLFGEAQFYTAALSTFLKHVVGRPRPNGEDLLSTPCQHCAQTFASSTYLALSISKDERLMATWEGPTMIGLSFLSAAVTSTGRVGAGKHHWTDVLAGMLLGAAVSTGVYAAHH